MTPERWRRITQVFHLARACDLSARAALLEEACADDLALRVEVEALLAAEDYAGAFGQTLGLLAGEEPRLDPGMPFGAYRIDALIGAGGMGEVYRAHDTRLDRDVAIKVLATTMSRDANARLLREARSAASLNHPNVCTIYEVGETDGHAYIAMELIDGEPLDQLIPAGGFPPEKILSYGLQIADAIAHAHERGLVHRDLKPANVMIANSGTAKVLDFGLAKTVSVADQPRLQFTASYTAAGLVIGTAAYMSPEQALGHTTDQRSDIFSFGVLLYEMATGRPAFTGATPMEVVDAVLHALPAPLASVRADMPAGLSPLIDKALGKNPSQRYQHISELTADLRSIDRTASRTWTRTAAVAIVAMFVAALIVWGATLAMRVTPTATPAGAVADVTAGKTRVAVLPFENLTRQAGDDWLANAFSDSLTLGLQSLDSLILVSRDGVAQAYREHSVKEAGGLEPKVIERLSRTVGIRYYVHGSYQRIDDQIKVIARLVEIGSGSIKAQESLTDRLANILQLEDVLARRFAASFESAGKLATRRPETTSLEAYRAITEGRGHYAAGRWQVALDPFKHAVDLDPEYAEAWAMLGKIYARLAAPSVFTGGSIDEFRSRAISAAKRAVELDASSYEAHVGLALAYRANAQVDGWRAAARKAIELNPRSAEGYAVLGDSYSETPAFGCNRDRDTPLTVSYYRQALRIDPTIVAYHYNLSNYLRYAGRLQEAVQVADEGVRLIPVRSSRSSAPGKTHALIALGRLDEAERVLREAIAEGGPRLEDQITFGNIDLKRGRFEAAAKAFRNALPPWGYVWRPEIARYYLEAGLVPPALDQLEQTFQAEAACAQWLLTTESSFWAVIRANPQARALLERTTRASYRHDP